MEVAFTSPDRAPDTSEPSGLRVRRWVKPAGVLIAIAIGGGAFFAAQASSFEIIGPQFGIAQAADVVTDDGSDSGGPASAAHAASSTDASDGSAGAHAAARAASGQGPGFLLASFSDGVTTLAQAADASFSKAPAPDTATSMLSTTPNRGDQGSAPAETFAGVVPAGFLGEGVNASGASGGGLAGAASGLPPQSATDSSPPGGALGALQPPQNVVTSVAGAPEPATWTMLILGFGLIGATLRRRRNLFNAG